MKHIQTNEYRLNESEIRDAISRYLSTTKGLTVESKDISLECNLCNSADIDTTEARIVVVSKKDIT